MLPSQARSGICWILEEARGGEGGGLEAGACSSELELQKRSPAVGHMGTKLTKTENEVLTPSQSHSCFLKGGKCRLK